MWTYEQSSGFIIARDGTKLNPPGYSGRGPGKNNPQMQAVPFVGPIPCGFYTIGEPYADYDTGPYTMSLTPDEGNVMYDRDEFKLHGDSIQHPGQASDGCIVQEHQNRVMVWTGLYGSEVADHRLQVVPGM